MDLLLIFSLIAIIVTTCAFIVGSMVDDFQDVKRRRLFRAHPYSRQYRTRPLVTVLLIAGIDSDMVRDALKHLQKNPYRRLECIVIGTTTNRAKLKKIATSLAKPTHPIYVFASKKLERSKLDAAYHRYGRGDVVVVLRDTDRLDTAAIQRSIWHFNAQKDISKLRASTIVSTHYSTIGLLQTYTKILTYFWNKLANSFTYTQASDNMNVSFYRTKAFLARYSHQQITTYNAEDVIAYRPAIIAHEIISHIHMTMARQVATLHRAASWPNPKNTPTTWLRILFLVCIGYLCITLPLLLTYVVFLAVIPHQPILLFISIAILSTYLLIGLWSQTGMSRLQKIRLSLLAPIYFVPFYVLSIISSIVAIAILLRIARTSLLRFEIPHRKAPLH